MVVLHVRNTEVLALVNDNTAHEFAWSGLDQRDVLWDFVEWGLGPGYLTKRHWRDQRMLLQRLVLSDFIHLGLVNILSLGKTMVVRLLGSVTAWVACLLLHKLHMIIFLLGGRDCVDLARLSLLLLSKVAAFSSLIWIGHILTGLRILLN